MDNQYLTLGGPVIILSNKYSYSIIETFGDILQFIGLLNCCFGHDFITCVSRTGSSVHNCT